MLSKGSYGDKMTSSGAYRGDESTRVAVDTSWLATPTGKGRRGRSTKRRTRRYTLSPSIGSNNVMSGVNWNDPEAFPDIPLVYTGKVGAYRSDRRVEATCKGELEVFRDDPVSPTHCTEKDADLPDPRDVARLWTPEAKRSSPPREVLGAVANKLASPMGQAERGSLSKGSYNHTGTRTGADSAVVETENLHPNRIHSSASGDVKQRARSSAVEVSNAAKKNIATVAQSRDEPGENASLHPQPVMKKKSRSSRRRSIIMPSEAQPLVDSELGSDGISGPAANTENAAVTVAVTKGSIACRGAQTQAEEMSKVKNVGIRGDNTEVSGSKKAAEEFPLSSVTATSCLSRSLAVQRGWQAGAGESSRELVRAYYAASAGSQRARRIAARLFCLTGFCLLPVTPDDARVLCSAAGDSLDWGFDEGEGPRLVSQPCRLTTKEQKRKLVMRIKPLFALMDKAAKDEKLATEAATGIVARKGSSERYCYEDRETGEPVDPSTYKIKYEEHIRAVAASKLRALRSLRDKSAPSPHSHGDSNEEEKCASVPNSTVADFEPNSDCSAAVDSSSAPSGPKGHGEVTIAGRGSNVEHSPQLLPRSDVTESLPKEAQDGHAAAATMLRSNGEGPEAGSTSLPKVTRKSVESIVMGRYPEERIEHTDKATDSATAGGPLEPTRGTDGHDSLARAGHPHENEGECNGPLEEPGDTKAEETPRSSVDDNGRVHFKLGNTYAQVSPARAPEQFILSAASGNDSFVSALTTIENISHVECELTRKADSRGEVGVGTWLSPGASLGKSASEVVPKLKQGDSSDVAAGGGDKTLTRRGETTPPKRCGVAHSDASLKPSRAAGRGVGSEVSGNAVGAGDVAMSPLTLSPVSFPVWPHYIDVPEVEQVDNIRNRRSSGNPAGGIDDLGSGSASISLTGDFKFSVAPDKIVSSGGTEKTMEELSALEERLWAKWDAALEEYRTGVALLEPKHRGHASTSATQTDEEKYSKRFPVSSVRATGDIEVACGNQLTQTRESSRRSNIDTPAAPTLSTRLYGDSIAPSSPLSPLLDLRLADEGGEEMIGFYSRHRREDRGKNSRAKSVTNRRRTLAPILRHHFEVEGGTHREQWDKQSVSVKGGFSRDGDADEGGAGVPVKCRLCFKMECDTVLRPCEHMLCGVCASKLRFAAEQSGQELLCPWDRQAVKWSVPSVEFS